MNIYKNNLGYVPARIWTSGLGLMLMEAFRRGLSLEVCPAKTTRGFLVRVSDGDKTYEFSGATAPITDSSASLLCRDKQATKDLLREHGIAVPKGVVIESAWGRSKILEHTKSLGYPLVLKPVDGIKGASVYTDITEESVLLNRIAEVAASAEITRWVVEEQIEGDEYRVLVVRGQLVSAIQRLRASVVGDGRRSIKKLVKGYNKERKNNPHFRKKPVRTGIHMDGVLSAQGIRIDDVPPPGVSVRLTGPANFAVGGGCRECTDSLPSKLREDSIAAVNAIPSLFHAGLDVILTASGEPVVLEINHNPDLGAHHFPTEGNGCDVASLIIDQHFPGSGDAGRHNVFFRMKELRALVTSGCADSVSLPRVAPDTESVRISIGALPERRDIVGRIVRIARSLNVHGSVRKLGSEGIEIVAAAAPYVLGQFESLLRNELLDLPEGCVEVGEWTYPVYFGFELVA